MKDTSETWAVYGWRPLDRSKVPPPEEVMAGRAHYDGDAPEWVATVFLPDGVVSLSPCQTHAEAVAALERFKAEVKA